MDEEMQEQLAACRQSLATLQQRLPTPAMITDADRGECYLRGNVTAYIAMAGEFLAAAQGEDVDLGKLYWLSSETWRFEGLIVTPAITERDRNRSRFRWKWNRTNLTAFATVALLVLFLLVGAITAIRWVILWIVSLWR